MSASWREEKLGKVLKQSEEQIDLNPTEQYQQVTIQLWGKGVVQRDVVYGSEIGANRRYVVRPRQFILSRIDARHGAFGLVPDYLDGAVVSNDFPSFNLDHTCLIPEFLGWLSRTKDFVEICRKASEGTTNRVRLKIDRFLAMPIRLPDPDEQRRIVAHIEALATRIEEARGLRQRAVEEAEALLASAVDEIVLEHPAEIVKMDEIACSITDGDHQSPPKVDTGIPFIFISNIVKGYIDFQNCQYVTPEYFGALSETRIPKQGDVLYTAVGSYGIPCLVDIDAPFCFQRHIAIIRPKQSYIVPKYLKWVLASSSVFDQATAFATGSAQLTVPLRGIRQLQFPLPSLDEQQDIVDYLDSLQNRVDELKRLQAESAAELDALLPSILDKAFRGEL